MEAMEKSVGDMMNAAGSRSDGTTEAINQKIEGIERIVKHLESMAKKDATEAKTGFKHKDAKDAKPSAWTDKEPFADLAMELRNWAKSFHKDYSQLLDTSEKQLDDFLT